MERKQLEKGDYHEKDIGNRARCRDLHLYSGAGRLQESPIASRGITDE